MRFESFEPRTGKRRRRRVETAKKSKKISFRVPAGVAAATAGNHLQNPIGEDDRKVGERRERLEREKGKREKRFVKMGEN